jgi:hypothetical protein
MDVCFNIVLSAFSPPDDKWVENLIAEEVYCAVRNRNELFGTPRNVCHLSEQSRKKTEGNKGRKEERREGRDGRERKNKKIKEEKRRKKERKIKENISIY